MKLASKSTESPTADELREQAARCRRLCSDALDPRTVESLNAMASEYEARAEQLDGGH